jgi:putative restriction endonuclease
MRAEGNGVSLFKIGAKYTRHRIYEILEVPVDRRRGNWETGYTSFNGQVFIFANIGVPGRSGHDYDNVWLGEQLRWRGKTGSRLHQPSIRQMFEPSIRVHIFTRSNDRDAFTYEGLGRVVSAEDTSPVTIVWSFERAGAS